MSCNELCRSKGRVFDVEKSQHVGNQYGRSFYPNKANGHNWETIECSSIYNDQNTNFGANGGVPNGDWKHTSCHVNCACK